MIQLNKLITANFPTNSVSLAFGYGSQVVKQAGAKLGSTRMIDLIIAVRDPLSWHEENLRRNNNHYSFLKYFGGANTVTKLQENFGAKIYFNTLVRVDQQLIKYGVINRDHLINDLLDWETLYIAGRLHKPTNFVIGPDCDYLRQALKINLDSALRSSLLLLPEIFLERQLYKMIVSLSYMGDFRMKFGEDKSKIDNILDAQLDRLINIYQPMLSSSTFQDVVKWNETKQHYVQDTSSSAVLHHLNLLPKHVQQQLYLAYRSKCDLDDVLMAVSESFYYERYVRKAISDITRKSSISQSLKGILTAGPSKSIRYGWHKIKKLIDSS
ncbi:Phosphatidate cytidylyltransferase, mitochondrial, partial [Fragariocoptes setiger]